MATLRIAGIVNDSITDGPGLRLTVFAQGCPHRCFGCHNPKTHDPLGGKDTGLEEILDKITANPLLEGVTFSGGEPFIQVKAFAEAARRIKALRPDLNLAVYTGYTWEELMVLPGAMELIELSDFIVDGPFVASLKSLGLKYAGSANQRFINVKESLKRGEIVQWNT